MASGVDLGKMVGPLPLGAWVAVVGGGFVFMTYTKRQSAISTTTPVAPADTTAGDTVGDGSVSSWADTSPPATGNGAPAITDNNSWGVAAVNWLIAQGYDPATSDSAIRKYLDQEAGYSAQEFALVRFAIGHFGPPPSILPAPVFGKPPVPVTGKPPVHKPPVHKPPVRRPVPAPHPKPHARYYTVRHGDTLSSIGKKYHVSWQSIYNANRRTIHNPNSIYPGQRLLIPNS